MPANVNIRRAQNRDRTQIIPLTVELYGENIDPINRPLVANYAEVIAHSWKKNNIQRALIFVAEEGETIVGYVMGAIHYADTMYPYKKLAHVGELVVHKTHQRQGIGRALLAAFESFALSKGADRVLLSADAHVTTRTFYEKMGYNVTQYRMLKIIS